MVARSGELAHRGAYGQVGAIVVAAGASRRMGGVDKVFAPLCRIPLLAYPVGVLEACPLVDQIVLVMAAHRLDDGQQLLQQQEWRKVTALCPGGERRQDSVANGLAHLQGCLWVVVHDGARPCLDPAMVQHGLEAAQETGAAIAAVPAKDTIKIVAPDGTVEDTPSREKLWMVQTPQVFRYDLLLEAHRKYQGTATDDASMVEAMGHRVRVFMGSYYNIKVTTPEDLHIAEGLLHGQGPGRDSG